ncbi:MAG: KEOPS complex subunit Pcc1 [Candidatus Jordarchaeales archaeon]
MNAKVVIEVEFSSSFEAEVTLKTLSPDNAPLPKNMKLSMERNENKLLIFLEYTGSISTLLSTLDDILASMKIIEDVSSTVQKA